MNIKLVLLAALVMGLGILIACAKDNASPIDKYYDTDIKNIDAEEGIVKASADLKAIMDECKGKRENSENIDWADVEIKIEPILDDLKEIRNKVNEINITDDNVKETNLHLINSLDKLISGYTNLIEGYEQQDEAILDKGINDLLESQNQILKWKELLNK